MLRIVVALILAVFAAGYIYREPLIATLKDQITRDMFVPADNDIYDPGLPVGTTFPPINARLDGIVVNSVNRFIGDKGMIFIASRSVDW